MRASTLPAAESGAKLGLLDDVTKHVPAVDVGVRILASFA
jgi:hypothetical protein